jgi:hypothetical protein
VAASVAAVAALLAIREARADRRESEHARLVRRVERAGEIVEELIWKAKADSEPTGPGGTTWIAPLHRLRQAIVGLRDRLPLCVVLVDKADTAQQAYDYAIAARSEIESDLQRLQDELIQPSGWWRRQLRRS